MFFFSVRKQLEFACKKCSDFAPSYYPISRLLFKFTAKELIDYLREGPDTSQRILMTDSDKRYSPATIIVPTERNYLVGIIPHNIQFMQRVQSFDKIEEAVADYVLFNWKLPRLRPIQSERTLRCPDFITFFDEEGNVFDKRHGRFKYYDQTEKKFISYD